MSQRVLVRAPSSLRSSRSLSCPMYVLIPYLSFFFDPLSVTSTGATRRPGGHHISRGHLRKRNDLHRRLRRQVFRRKHLSFRVHNISVAGPSDKHHLELEVRKAHVICVVYAIDDSNSFNRIPVYWLPYFRQLGINVRSEYHLAYPSPHFDTLLGTRHPGRE